jgi:hypothetical protein
MKCSWFSTPPSSSSTPSTQESTSEAPDTYPNGKCPRKCICAEKYFGNVCEYLGDVVADYESQIRSDLQPAPPRPTRERLVELATRGFWLEKGQDMPLRNPSEDLDLDCPLPPCFHAMHQNIKNILSDFSDLEIEVYGRSLAPPGEDGTNPTSPLQIKLEPCEEEGGPEVGTALMAAGVEDGPPVKKLRQSTLAQAFGGRTHTAKHQY